MIDLNAKVEGANRVSDFTPIPNGDYQVVVDKMTDWESKVLDINVNTRGADGKIVKGADGKNVKTVVKDATIYSANVTFEVTQGEFKGRRLFLNISTHPDLMFRSESILWAVGQKDTILGKMKEAVVGKPLTVTTEIRKRPFKQVDKTTGATTYVDKEYNEITKFAKPSLIPNEEFDV